MPSVSAVMKLGPFSFSFLGVFLYLIAKENTLGQCLVQGSESKGWPGFLQHPGQFLAFSVLQFCFPSKKKGSFQASP